MANVTLCWVHCLDKQKVSSVSRSTNTPPVFLHTFFRKWSANQRKNTGQCFLFNWRPHAKIQALLKKIFFYVNFHVTLPYYILTVWIKFWAFAGGGGVSSDAYIWQAVIPKSLLNTSLWTTLTHSWTRSESSDIILLWLVSWQCIIPFDDNVHCYN